MASKLEGKPGPWRSSKNEEKKKKKGNEKKNIKTAEADAHSKSNEKKLQCNQPNQASKQEAPTTEASTIKKEDTTTDPVAPTTDPTPKDPVAPTTVLTPLMRDLSLEAEKSIMPGFLANYVPRPRAANNRATNNRGANNGSRNSGPGNSVPGNSLPANSVPDNSGPGNSVPVNSVPANSGQTNSGPANNGDSKSSPPKMISENNLDTSKCEDKERKEENQNSEKDQSEDQDMAKSRRSPKTCSGELVVRPRDGPGAADRPSTSSASSTVASPEPVIKHPLEHTWAFWYFKNDKTKDWKENQRYILSFSTIEDFWALFNHLEMPSNLGQGCDYSMFKEGIEPMWEDPKNKDGGRWLVNTVKAHRAQILDRLWTHTLLCLIGHMFGKYSDDVCGAVVNLRPKGDKLAVWTRDAENQESNMFIGTKLRQELELPKQFQLGFQAHKDTITKYGSITRNKYIA